MGFSLDYVRYLASQPGAVDRWTRLGAERPETFYLWHRMSPRLLTPVGARDSVSGNNPPLSVSGMTLLVVDSAGRLAQFHARCKPGVPPRV